METGSKVSLTQNIYKRKQISIKFSDHAVLNFNLIYFKIPDKGQHFEVHSTPKRFRISSKLFLTESFRLRKSQEFCISWIFFFLPHKK